MQAFTQGKSLTSGDLCLLIRDTTGQMVDPVSITYTIFADRQGHFSLVSTPNATPSQAGSGQYYVGLTVPTEWEGTYKLIWYLKQYADSEEIQVTQEFVVVRVDPGSTSLDAPSILMAINPGITPKIAQLVIQVREVLSDTNPDRNYHFRPPTPGKVVAGYNARVGYIWTDVTIIRMLRLTIAKLNTWNVMSWFSHTLETIPEEWAQAAVIGAAASCLTAEACRWTVDEFSYGLNGVNLDINKASQYQSLAESLKAEFTEWAPLITANRPTSCGLRQQRWLI